MKIVFLGDSITDMGRNRNEDFTAFSYGNSYPIFIQSELGLKYPNQFEIYNRGIFGDRSVDVYARIKKDLWNLNPDYVSILIGINDIWHEIQSQNGVEIERFEKVYRNIIQDTKKAVKLQKIFLLEPFVLKGLETEKYFDKFCMIKEYAKIVKKLAKENDCVFIPLQKTIDYYAEKYGSAYILFDGVHPTIVGGKIIADEWLKCFKKFITGEEMKND